jgi:Na+/H+-translocating membrane pyrophosphatase
VAVFYLDNANYGKGRRSFAAVAAGLLLAQVVGRLTEHSTSARRRPVHKIADRVRPVRRSGEADQRR